MDGACQDIRFSDDFFVDLIFAPVEHDDETSRNTNSESLSILQDDKAGFDDMLNRDESFWVDIANRKKRHTMGNNTTTTTAHVVNDSSSANHNSFSITDHCEEEKKEEDKEISPKETKRKKSWGDDQDAELLAQLQSMETSEESEKVVSSLDPEKGVVNVVQVDKYCLDAKSTLLSCKDNDNSGVEMMDLSSIDKELGLEEFTDEFNQLSNSNIKDDGEDIDLDFLDDELAALTLDAAASTTNNTTSSSTTEMDLDGDDNFDELEQYLDGLSKQ